jgi:hypothetical protein
MTDKPTPKRLVGYSTLQFPEDSLRLEDIAGQEVSILSAHIGTGKFGEYAVLDIERASGDIQTIVTSGMLVVDAVKNALLAPEFPIAAKFSRTGRAWRIE